MKRLLPVLAMLWGCKSQVDVGKLRATIESELKSKAWPVKAVSCPQAVEAKKGQGFECSVELEDVPPVSLHVDQVDDMGNTAWDAPKTVFVLAPAIDVVKKSFVEQNGYSVDVECPKRVVILGEKGAKLTCKAREPASERQRTGHPDKPGEIEFTIAPTGAFEWKYVTEEGRKFDQELNDLLKSRR